MNDPGVGPVVALTYRAHVAVPSPVRKSKVQRGGCLRLSCSSINQARSIGAQNIALCDEMMRDACSTKAAEHDAIQKNGLDQRGALQIARRRGRKKAIACARAPVAVIMHRIWVDGTSSGGPGASRAAA